MKGVLQKGRTGTDKFPHEDAMIIKGGSGLKVAMLGDARWMEEVRSIQRYFGDRDKSNKSLCVYVEIWKFQGTVVSFYSTHG